MARQLADPGTRISVGGTASAPSTCVMEYSVSDGDLKEDATRYVEGSPNFNQQVDALCPAVGTTVKTAESI